MPAYDQPIKFILPPKDPKVKNAVAAVIRFEDPSDLQRIQAFLDRLAARGIIREARAVEYNMDFTSAELYFP